MCIKVEQDERQKTDMRPRRPEEAPGPSTAMALTVEMSVVSLQAGAVLLWIAASNTWVARGRRLDLAAGLHEYMRRPAGNDKGDSEALRLLRTSSIVDACPAAGSLVVPLGMQNMHVLGLDDGSGPWAWVAWIDLPPQMPHQQAHALMRLTGQALNEQRRTQACAERVALRAQRLEDVAYACGDWMWETDDAHRYTWVQSDSARESGDSSSPRPGDRIPDALAVDWLGQAAASAMTLHQVLDRRQPLVRFVVQEATEAGVRYVSRSAVPLVDANGVFRGYRGSMRDVTESVEKARMWLRDERLRQAALALPGAVVHASGPSWTSARLDDHGGRLSELLSLSPGEAGHSLRRALRQLPRDERRALLRTCADGEKSGRVVHRRLQTRCSAPAARWIDVHATFERDLKGTVSCSVFVADVTAHVCAEQVLRSAKEQAEASSRDKSALVSKVSHELKTPLNAIVGLAQLIQMKRRPEGRAGIDDWVDQIACAGWHMTDVIDTLMEFGRVGSGRAGIRCEPVDLHQVLQEAIRITEREARQRRVSITVSTPDFPEAAMARCDHRAVRQVFVNLLSNAVKYNCEGGRVWVSARCADPVVVTVRDSGPGLSPQQLERMFQPFERLGAEQTGVQGNGLGLLICKELVGAMGGSIDVRSVQGHGCSFAVSLMAAQPQRCHPPQARLRAA